MEKALDVKKPTSGDSLEDSEMKGVSSLLKMKKEGWGEDETTDDKAEGLDFVLRGIDMNNEENGYKKRKADGDLHDGVSGSIAGSFLGNIVGSVVNGNVSAENGVYQMDSKNEERDSLGAEEHSYCVGDFVWGKIKSHPWWPGRVYDPSDASDYAAKLRQGGKLLVAYFGDGTFAWCLPSQLRPFENFDEMVKQSSSRVFHNAVKEALEEIGRLVNHNMICQCVKGTEQSRRCVVNSGLKEGVCFPEEGISKLAGSWIEPTHLLTSLRHKAQMVNVSSGLELGVLTGWVLGFYRAKVGFRYELPRYVDPEPILGLEDPEDGGRNGRVDGGDNGEMGILSRGPVEEEKEAENHGASENGTQRKEKSIAEILSADIQTKEKANPRKRKMSGLLASSPVIQSRGSGEEVNESGEGKKEKKKRGRKKKRPDLGSGSGEGAVEESEQQKEKRIDESEAEGSSKKGYVARERKKSKYLSPPYTNVNKGDKKGDVMAESLGVSGIARMGERLNKAAGNLLGPDEKLSHESLTEVPTEQNKRDSQTPEQVKGETVDQMEVKASAREVLLEVHSLARDPQRRVSLDAVEGFLRNFRISVYKDDSQSDVKTKGKPGRKRKSQDKSDDPSSQIIKTRGRKPKKPTESETDAVKLHGVPISLNETSGDFLSPETKTKRKRTKKAIESGSDTPNVKETKEPEQTNQKTGDKGANLVVSFGPGSSLPTKEDLLGIFQKFGPLRKGETSMYYNNFCGIVAFKKTSNAESALNSCRKASPFGPASVNFELKQPSPKKPKKDPASQLKKPMKSSSAADPKSGASEVTVIKERLQTVTSMLNRSNGKLSKKMRAQLEGELKGILEKVSAGGGSSSSP